MSRLQWGQPELMAILAIHRYVIIKNQLAAAEASAALCGAPVDAARSRQWTIVYE